MNIHVQARYCSLEATLRDNMTEHSWFFAFLKMCDMYRDFVYPFFNNMYKNMIVFQKLYLFIRKRGARIISIYQKSVILIYILGV